MQQYSQLIFRRDPRFFSSSTRFWFPRHPFLKLSSLPRSIPIHLSLYLLSLPMKVKVKISLFHFVFLLSSLPFTNALGSDTTLAVVDSTATVCGINHHNKPKASTVFFKLHILASEKPFTSSLLSTLFLSH